MKLFRSNIWSFQVAPVVTTTCNEPVPWVMSAGVVEMDLVALVPVQVPLAVRLSQLLKSDVQTTVGVGERVIVGVKVTVAVEVRVGVGVALGSVPVEVKVGVRVLVAEEVAVEVEVGVEVAKPWERVSS